MGGPKLQATWLGKFASFARYSDVSHQPLGTVQIEAAYHSASKLHDQSSGFCQFPPGDYLDNVTFQSLFWNGCAVL